jgi:DNA-binding transcriptional regulator YiaG
LSVVTALASNDSSPRVKRPAPAAPVTSQRPKHFDPTAARQIRERRGLSREVVAKAIGRSPSALASWETGRWAPPSRACALLADVYGVELGELVRDEGIDNVGEIDRWISAVVRQVPPLSPEQERRLFTLLSAGSAVRRDAQSQLEIQR